MSLNWSLENLRGTQPGMLCAMHKLYCMYNLTKILLKYINNQRQKSLHDIPTCDFARRVLLKSNQPSFIILRCWSMAEHLQHWSYFFLARVKVIKKVWAEQTAGQYTMADVCYTCKLNKNRTRTLLLLKLSIVICPASRVPKGLGCPLSVRLLLPNSKWVGGNCTLAFCLGAWLAGGVMVFLDHFVL